MKEGTYYRRNSIKEYKTLKEKIFYIWVAFRDRQGRGSGFLSQFWDYISKGALMSILADKLGIYIAPDKYLPLAVGYLVTCYAWGLFDEKVLKLWQFDNNLEMVRVNPYYQRIEDKIDKLLEGQNDKQKSKRRNN